MPLPISLQATEISDAFLHEKHKVFPESYGGTLLFQEPWARSVSAVSLLFVPRHEANEELGFTYSFNNCLADESSHIVASDDFETAFRQQVLKPVDVLFVSEPTRKKYRIAAYIGPRWNSRQPVEDFVDFSGKILNSWSIGTVL